MYPVWISLKPKVYKLEIVDTVVEGRSEKQKTLGLFFRRWKDLPVSWMAYQDL